MAQIQLANGRTIGDYQRPYFVAELNSSHGGSLENAKKMIHAAKESGCDAVKFQSWTAETLYAKTFYEKNKVAEKIIKKFQLEETELEELFALCKEIKIDFASTAYSTKEVDLLVKNEVHFIKIASMEINNIEFIKYIATTNIPVVLSTGMAELDEIKKAVDILINNGCTQLALLHCISLYPTKPENINLNNIPMLRRNFPEIPVGFSDHTLGNEVSIAATALGTALIEKHFTLDARKMGMDNNMAIEPQQMQMLVENCIAVHAALGSNERIVSEEEYAQRKKMRRSIIASHDLKAGHILTIHDLGAKRPGNGIPVDKMSLVLGKKLLHNVDADTLITDKDIF